MKELVKYETDIFIINKANISPQNKQFIKTPGYNKHILYKSRQIASGILVGSKTDLTTTLLDTAEIVEIYVWKHNHQTGIYGIYSPPNNKCLNLDILDLTNNTVIVGDFNAASPNWGYTYKNAPGKAVEEFLVANTIELLYNPKYPPTYLHYDGHATNPDLSTVSMNLANLSTRC
jgi:hypothetical protein